MFYPGVVLRWNGAPGSWSAYMPDGAPIDISASTTNGLQEAINAACVGLGAPGYDLYVYGGDMASGGAAVLNCSTPIVWPPMQGKTISINSTTISITNAVGSQMGMKFDSCMMVNFDLRGSQIGYAGTGVAVGFVPTNGVPLDGLVTIVDSEFNICTVVTSQAGTLVRFDPANGSIANNRFSFTEINASGGNTTGMHVLSKPSAFAMNEVSAVHIHSSIGTSVALGGTNVFSNIFNLGISPATSNNPAIQIFGVSNELHLNIHNGQGQPGNGIKFEPSASKNTIFMRQNKATLKVNDQSTLHDNNVLYG